MYEATKEDGFQLPFKNTVKPLKMRTTENEMNCPLAPSFDVVR
jgi:hypothetical protein